jgi:septal ring factor EnvC (AmiA/AmiB activator)
MCIALLVLYEAILSAGASATPAVQNDIQEKRKELSRIGEQIELNSRRRSTLIREEKELLSLMEEMEKEIDLQEKYILTSEEHQRILERDIRKLYSQEEHLASELSERQALLAGRLYGLYMHGRNFAWKVLLSSSSIIDFKKRFVFLKMIAHQDNRLIGEIKNNLLKKAKIRESIETEKEEISRLIEERSIHRDQLQRRKNDRENLLEEILSQRVTYEKAIEELKAAQRELEELIRKLEEEKQRDDTYGDEPASNLKGRLLWPLKGEILSRYGRIRHPRFYTVTFNKGIDISAENGADVIAAWDGQVAYAGWLHGLGKCVIIDHGGSIYTLYGHLRRLLVSRDDSVEGGQSIAEAGMSGMVRDCRLHFEVWNGRDAQNPEEWLTGSK